MEQDFEQSPINREPTACSEPPVVHRDTAVPEGREMIQTTSSSVIKFGSEWGVE